MSGTLMLVLLPAMLFILGAFIELRRTGLGVWLASLVVMLAVGQAGVTMALVGRGHTLWLALALGAVAASAAGFAEREDARRVILFGGALAAIQIADPLGGLLAAGLVPAAVAMRDGVEPRRRAGLYALLLFLPVMTAGVLLYAARVWHMAPLDVIAGAAFVPRVSNLGARLMVAAAPILAALPALVAARVSVGGRAVGLVAGAALASACLGAVAGAVREPVTLLAATAPLTIAAVASLPSSVTRPRQAVLLAASCAALSWLALSIVG